MRGAYVETAANSICLHDNGGLHMELCGRLGDEIDQAAW